MENLRHDCRTVHENWKPVLSRRILPSPIDSNHLYDLSVGLKGLPGVGFGVSFFVSGLYKFMGKLADRIFFGVQGPRGLGLGCRSLCLAFISLWEN